MPDESSISAVTLAELVAGVHSARDARERAVRQDRLQRVEATLEAIPFDADAARAYGRVFAAIVSGGRKARGRRAIDLLIAATAAAAGLPLYTRNPEDFSGLKGIVEVVPVRP
jgi:predicted nucleic acid-binding protein